MIMRCLCFLLLGAILYCQSSKLVIYLNFKINQEYISKELCENREVPEKNCNGKCYLSKQLQKQDKKEKKEKAPIKQRIKIDVLCFVIKPVCNVLINSKLKDNNLCFNFIYKLKKGYLTKVFQPPQIG